MRPPSIRSRRLAEATLERPGIAALIERLAPATPRKRRLPLQLLAYTLIGGTNVAVTYIVLNLVVFLWSAEEAWQLTLASAIAFIAAMLNSYVWNSRITFASRLRNAPQVARFVAVHGVGLAVNIAVFSAAIVPLQQLDELSPHSASTIAQTAALLATFVSNFTLLRLWAYRLPFALAPIEREGEEDAA